VSVVSRKLRMGDTPGSESGSTRRTGGGRIEAGYTSLDNAAMLASNWRRKSTRLTVAGREGVGILLTHCLKIAHEPKNRVSSFPHS
jgi:hypothetical protein